MQRVRYFGWQSRRKLGKFGVKVRFIIWDQVSTDLTKWSGSAADPSRWIFLKVHPSEDMGLRVITDEFTC